jgi:hypothetical protein
MGYYDNGAPLYTWQQTTWTDLRTALHLHTVRYVLLHVGEAESDRVAPLIGDAGYQMAFASGNVQIWENPQVEGYTRFYSQAALDLPKISTIFCSVARFRLAAYCDGVAVFVFSRRAGSHHAQRVQVMLVDDAAARDALSPDRLQNATGRLVIDTEVATLDPAPEVQVSARIERLPFKAIQIDLQAPTKGILSLSESWYPHWRVRVDAAASHFARDWAQRASARTGNPSRVLLSAALVCARGLWRYHRFRVGADRLVDVVWRIRAQSPATNLVARFVRP